MNKSQSKYFNTALKMDKAFLELLSKKDFEYITVKEICARAGVNRSTFYLHYETVSDLLCESVEYVNSSFLEYIKSDSGEFIKGIKDCPIDKLYLITPEYLNPYLNYIRENKQLFQTVTKNAYALGFDEIYGKMFDNVFTPILERYNVDSRDREYIMSFYIHGIYAVITQWLRGDCKDSNEHIISVITQCVTRHEEEV